MGTSAAEYTRRGAVHQPNARSDTQKFLGFPKKLVKKNPRDEAAQPLPSCFCSSFIISSASLSVSIWIRTVWMR